MRNVNKHKTQLPVGTIHKVKFLTELNPPTFKVNSVDLIDEGINTVEIDLSGSPILIENEMTMHFVIGFDLNLISMMQINVGGVYDGKFNVATP